MTLFWCIGTCRPRDRSVAAAWGRKSGGKYWERWCTDNNWLERAAKHDSDLASRRRERMVKELERAQDDAVVLIRSVLGKVAERIQVMDPKELSAGQIPAALKTLVELEFKALGQEDKMTLKHEGKLELDDAPRAKLLAKLEAMTAAVEPVEEAKEDDNAEGD